METLTERRNFFWDHFGWELCNRACYYTTENFSGSKHRIHIFLFFGSKLRYRLAPVGERSLHILLIFLHITIYYITATIIIIFKEQNILKEQNTEQVRCMGNAGYIYIFL